MPNVIKQIVKAGEYGTQTIKMIVKANERGPQGKQGERGVQGPQGIPGPRGFDGAIQYRAGTGIKITDDNIIEATGESIAAWGGIQGNIQDQTDLQNEFSQYVKPADLATVATTGDYDDLTDKPTIPTVNDATLTIQSDGTTVGTFTANSATNVTANVIPPVRVGSVISQPTDVAFVDTVNIVDEAVTANKIDFSTIKRTLYSTDNTGTIVDPITLSEPVGNYDALEIWYNQKDTPVQRYAKIDSSAYSGFVLSEAYKSGGIDYISMYSSAYSVSNTSIQNISSSSGGISWGIPTGAVAGSTTENQIVIRKVVGVKES